MSRTLSACALLTMALAGPARAWVEPGQVIVFDQTLSVHLIQGPENELRLRICRGDSSEETALPAEGEHSAQVVFDRVREARFFDRSRLWIIAYLGPYANGAFLLNIETGALEAELLGNSISISPSGEHIAYRATHTRHGNDALFVDGVRVVPSAPDPPTGPLVRREITGPLRWVNDNTVEADLVETRGAGPSGPERRIATRVSVTAPDLAELRLDQPRDGAPSPRIGQFEIVRISASPERGH